MGCRARTVDIAAAFGNSSTTLTGSNSKDKMLVSISRRMPYRRRMGSELTWGMVSGTIGRFTMRTRELPTGTSRGTGAVPAGGILSSTGNPCSNRARSMGSIKGGTDGFWSGCVVARTCVGMWALRTTYMSKVDPRSPPGCGVGRTLKWWQSASRADPCEKKDGRCIRRECSWQSRRKISCGRVQAKKKSRGGSYN